MGAPRWVLELWLVAEAVAAINMGEFGERRPSRGLYSSWMLSLVRQSGSELFSAYHVPSSVLFLVILG